jgi:preprotein translocase subunit YajC
MALLLTMVVLFGLMWFLLIRPQQRKQQQQRSLLESLAVGQEVLTAGGIYGTITDLDIEEVVLEIAPEVNVRVDKRAIATVIEAEEVDEDPYAAPEAPEAPAPVEAERR